MEELKEIIDSLSVSRPILMAELSSPANFRIDVHEPVYKFKVESIEGNTEIKNLIIQKYDESFDFRSGTFSIDKNKIYNECRYTIRHSVAKFVANNLKTKAPTQTKLYRWAKYDLPDTTHFDEIVLSLYKYLCSFCDNYTMKVHAFDGQKHAENAIALIMALQEKYGK